MPIQLKEAYASMWLNLSPIKQESIIKTTINKIDEFSNFCFDNYDHINDLTDSSHPSKSLNSLERMFKMLLTLNNHRSLDKIDIKTIYFEKVMEVKNNLGNSNFIWSSIACNIKDAFSMEHFFMNLMIQQLDTLYFKTFIINELQAETVDDKKKTKKKKNKKKKVKESGCCDKHPDYIVDCHLNTKNNDDGISKENKNIDIKSDNIKRNYYKQINNDNSLITNIHTSLLTSNNTPFFDNRSAFDVSQLHAENMIEAYLYINNPSYGDKNGGTVKDIETSYICLELREVVNDRCGDNEIDKNDMNEEIEANKGVKDSGRSSDIRLDDNKIAKKIETECSKEVRENNVIEPKIYNRITNTNEKLAFDNNSTYKYEINIKNQPPIFHVHKSGDKNLSSLVLNKESEPINRLETNDDIHSVSNDMTTSTKADSKRKRAKYEDETAEIDMQKIPKTDSEFDEDNLNENIMEFHPKKHMSNDDYSKNRSTEYNKHIQYQNHKQMPIKLNNSNIILNDLNKIDGKPKKPKLKKMNKDTKKPKKGEENIIYVEKTQNKVVKNKQVEKDKASNQDPKITKKNSNPINKAEINASIKVISYWNDEPEFGNTYSKKHKDTAANLHLSKNDSDNYSVCNKRKGGEREKLKLKKGVVSDKQPQLRRKQNAPHAQTRQKDALLQKEAPFLNKNKSVVPQINVNEDVNIAETTGKFNAKDILKAKFNATMNSKIDEVIIELENHTQKLEQGRKIIQERISTIVDRTFNADTVYVQEYGSYATRLLTPYSDMDLSIQGCLMLNRDQAIEMLQVLCDNLKLFGFVISATSILTAIVPVIKIEADPSIEFESSETITEPLSLKVDIIVDLMDGFNPISTALRTTDYIKYCISNYPSFYKNVLFLKFALNCNAMTNTYKGGLNAYGLCILYIAYIEFHQLEKSTNNFDLLKGFLKFISTQFSPETQAVYFGTAFR